MIDRVRGLLTRLRATLRPGVADRELDEEIRFHIEKETEEGVRSGLSPEDARRRAMVRFGGVDRFFEEVRRLRPLEEVRQDLRIALRMLRRAPTFTLAAVLTLGLGIGANTAVFSVVNAVLLRPSPFEDPGHLVMIWETDRDSGTRHEPASWPDVVDFRERSRTMASINAMAAMDATLTGSSAGPERVAVVGVTPGFVGMLGVRPLLGRLFSSREGAADRPSVALLGEGLWRSRFHGDSALVGRTITLDGGPVTVVGVLPASADLGIQQIQSRADYGGSPGSGNVDVWLAMVPSQATYPRETHPFLTLGRLAPAVALTAAQRELTAVAARLESTYPANEARGVNLESFEDVVFGPVRTSLWVLLGAAGLVLLITCVNLASLLLARMAARTREVAIRGSLGAGPSRLTRQFLVESGVLTACGAALGVFLAHEGLHVLLAMAPADIPRVTGARVDGTVLSFTAALAALAAIVFGLLPAARVRRMDLHGLLKAEIGVGGSEGRSSRRFRRGLVVAEIALAVTLVTGAGLLLRSFGKLQGVDPGFDANNVLEASFQFPPSRYPQERAAYPNWPEIHSFETDLLSRVRALPGVVSAALAGVGPLDPGFTNSFVIVGREEESSDFPEIRTRFVTPGYLTTMGERLLAGRDLQSGDDLHAPAVVLINEAAAERYFHGSNPIGHELSWWGTSRRIVGVVGNERFQGLRRPPDPAAYAPLAQMPWGRATLLVRLDDDGQSLVASVRAQVRALDPEIALFDVQTLRRALSGSIARPRLTSALAGLFGALALVLALVGIHGVVTYTAAQRASEVGLRMALGASRTDILLRVMTEGLTLGLLGTSLGLVMALAVAGLMRSLLYGIRATDPVTFTLVPTAVLVTAVLATSVPALRASRSDPVDALRSE